MDLCQKIVKKIPNQNFMKAQGDVTSKLKKVSIQLQSNKKKSSTSSQFCNFNFVLCDFFWKQYGEKK